MATALTRQLVGRLRRAGDVLHHFADAEARCEEYLRDLGDGSRVHVVWVDWSSRDLRRLSPGDLVLVREAFTLLYMLSRLDKRVWLDQMERYWHLNDTRRPLSSPHACAIGVQLQVTQPETIATLALSSLSTDYVAPALRELRGDVDALLKQGGRGLSRCGIRVELTVDSERKTQEYMAEIFLGLAQLLATTRAMHGQPLLLGGQGSGHVIKKFEIKRLSVRHVDLPVDSLQFLKIVAHNGLRVSHLSGIVANRTTDTNDRTVDALQWLIPSCLNKEPVMEPTSGVKSVIIHSTWPAHFVPAIFSALQYSQSVHSLEFGTFRHDLDAIDTKSWQNKLRWFTFAVLSQHARHNIRKLKLESYCIEATDVEIMRAELTKPSTIPLTSEALTTPPVLITSSRFYLTKPQALRENRTPARDTIYSASFPTTTRVCTHHSAKQIYSVLLPGYGLAWVHHDDVGEIHGDEDLPAPTGCLEEVIIPELHIRSMDAVASFIELFGQQLKSVRIDDSSDQCSVTDWCRRVLASCPQLERLCMHGVKVERLNFFAENAVLRGTRLRALECGVVGSGTEGFVEALCDPNHPLTTNLHELSLRIVIHGSNGEEDDLDAIDLAFLEPCALMLDQNRILHDVELEVACIDCSHDVYRLVSDVLSRFTSEDVAIRVDRMLDIDRRVGFLFAVAKAPESSAMHFLDTNVMARIFHFATEERQRRVCVSIVEE